MWGRVTEADDAMLVASDGRPSLAGQAATGVVLYLGLILLVFGLRIVVISFAGSITPYMDEWGSDITRLAVPWATGRLQVADLFLYCNEHLVFFTKLLTILSVCLVGYYDPIAKMIFNAALSAGTFALCLHLLTKCLNAPWRLLAVTGAGLFMAVPFGLENILMGFNSHFYFIILFAVSGLWFLALNRAWSVRWLVGLVLSFCSFLCMASGALTFAAAAGVAMLQIGCRQRAGVRELFGLAALLAITVGLIASVPPNSAADPIHAHSPGQFVFALVFQLASWPRRTLLGPLIYLPALVFLWRTLRDRASIADARWFNIAVLGWVATQYAALAYGRAGYLLPSRYLETVQLGVAASIVAVAWLVSRMSRKTKPVTRVAMLAWLGMLTIGTALQARHDVSTRLVPQRGQGANWTLEVQGYYRTQDYRILAGKTYPEIAYVEAAQLKDMLDDKDVKALLSPQLRGSRLPANAVEAVKAAILAHGWTMALLGLALTLVAAWMSWNYRDRCENPLTT